MKIVKFIKDPHVPHHPDQMSKGYPGSAAHDLYLPGDFEHKVIGPNQTIKADLGFRIHINNENIAAMILPRSGTGVRGLVVGNLVGLIDQDYQGPIGLSLWNRTDEPIRIDTNKAVAQMVFVPVEQITLMQVTDFDCVTERGEGGFGSSDVKEDSSIPIKFEDYPEVNLYAYTGSSLATVPDRYVSQGKPYIGFGSTQLPVACLMRDKEKVDQLAKEITRLRIDGHEGITAVSVPVAGLGNKTAKLQVSEIRLDYHDPAEAHYTLTIESFERGEGGFGSSDSQRDISKTVRS